MIMLGYYSRLHCVWARRLPQNRRTAVAVHTITLFDVAWNILSIIIHTFPSAPTTFSSQNLACMDWANTTAGRDKKHFSFGIWCGIYERFDGTSWWFRVFLGPVSLSDQTFYCMISWNLEASRLVVGIIALLCNLTGSSAALPPRCLSNFTAIRQFETPISRLRDFANSYDKTSYLILKRPGLLTSRRVVLCVYLLVSILVTILIIITIHVSSWLHGLHCLVSPLLKMIWYAII